MRLILRLILDPIEASMGGYGLYVWSSYALTFAVLAICVVLARRRHRRIVHEIKLRLKAETGK